MRSFRDRGGAAVSGEKLSPLMIFALEKYVNTGARHFMIGDRLFEAQVHPRHLTALGPLGIIFVKGLKKSRQNWRTMKGVGSYRISYEYRNEQGREIRHSEDWLDIEDEYK